jgi:pullulanase
MTKTEMIQKHLNFLPTPVTNTIAYNISGSANGDSFADIVVLFNANVSEVKFKLPHFGVWNILVNQEKAGTKILHKFTGDDIVVPELTSMVLYSNEKLVNEVTIVGKEKTDYRKYAGYALGALGLLMLLRRRRRRK